MLYAVTYQKKKKKVNKLAIHLMFMYHANDQLSNMPWNTFDGNTPHEKAYFACVPYQKKNILHVFLGLDFCRNN
jgi:hypothetical protein